MAGGGFALLLFIVATGVIVGLQIKDKRLTWRPAIACGLFGLFVGGTAAGPVLRESVLAFFVWVLTGVVQLASQ